MIFKKVYEELGYLRASIESINEKQDMILNRYERNEDRVVRKDEFNLFKRISYSTIGLMISALAFIFTRVL